MLFRILHEFHNSSVFLQFLNYTSQVRYFSNFKYTCLGYKCFLTKLIVAFSICMLSFELSNIYRNSDIIVNFQKLQEQHNTELDQGSTYPNSPRTTSQVGHKSPMWAISVVITPACLYTFGRVYWVLSMGVYIGLHIQLMWFYYRLLVSPTDQSDSLH